jgi:hypothetical protein
MNRNALGLNTTNPCENIYFKGTSIQRGRYTFSVVNYKKRGTGPTKFTVRLLHGNVKKDQVFADIANKAKVNAFEMTYSGGGGPNIGSDRVTFPGGKGQCRDILKKQAQPLFAARIKKQFLAISRSAVVEIRKIIEHRWGILSGLLLKLKILDPWLSSSAWLSHPREEDDDNQADDDDQIFAFSTPPAWPINLDTIANDVVKFDIEKIVKRVRDSPDGSAVELYQSDFRDAVLKEFTKAAEDAGEIILQNVTGTLSVVFEKFKEFAEKERQNAAAIIARSKAVQDNQLNLEDTRRLIERVRSLSLPPPPFRALTPLSPFGIADLTDLKLF